MSLSESPSGQLVLGNSPTGDAPWAGDIFGLAVYNRSLTAEEVGRDYRLWTNRAFSSLATQAGITALFSFDDGHGSLVHNSVAHGPPLLIPHPFVPARRIFLAPPSRRTFLDIRDLSANIAGFVPFGFFLSLYFHDAKHSKIRSVITATIIGLAISIVIELLQGYLPSRDSSLTDVINNTMGTSIGALLAAVASPFSQPIS